MLEFALTCSSAFCLTSCRGVSASQKQATPIIPVVVAKAYQSDVPIEVRVPAAITPVVTVNVKSEVSGVLRRTLIHEGETVRVGDALFEIEPAPFEAALRQARAQLGRDIAQKQQAEAILERDIAAAQNADRQAERYDHLAPRPGSPGDESNPTARWFRRLERADTGGCLIAVALNHAPMNAPSPPRYSVLIALRKATGRQCRSVVQGGCLSPHCP
ncbi:biotin/lipoyl-binding protein [Acidobacteria bacterium AB60]|nr:biotin/lipoyl-binding protein [Acidobacteria bacterium AB60]